MASILPLRVTPSEKYFITDDRPGYRMAFVVDHTFEGEIDREAFESGLAEASARHPLLNALLEYRAWGNMWWIPSGTVAPAINWGDIDTPVKFPDDHGIDLTKEVGVRLFVRVGRGQSRLVVQFHHACCDGVGAIQFLSDLLTGYVRTKRPDADRLPEFQPTDPQRLHTRNVVGAHWESLGELRQIMAAMVKSMMDHEFHQPVPIAAPISAPSTAAFDFPCTMTRTLEAGVHGALRKLARNHEVTVHELMVRELMMTIREWNRRQGVSSDNDWISILVPANSRTYQHDGLPAANVVGCSSFIRRATMCDNPAALLDSIREESAFSRRTRLPAVFISALKLLDWIPGGAKFMTGRPRCCASAFLSSVGDPSRAIAAQYPLNADGNPIMANLVLTDVNSAPAVRYLTRAAFASWHFSGKQRLGVRCDPTIFAANQASDLLQLFSDRVVALAGSSTETRTPVRRAA